MKKLETIIAEAKAKTPLIVAQINAKHEARKKEQERLEALDIDWDFDFIIERHDSDWVEYALVGYDKNGVKYSAQTGTFGSHPSLKDDVITDIELY